MPYFHGVFTLPQELQALVLANQRPLLTLRLRAASQTLLQVGRQTLGGPLGGIPVLHTWDQTLGAHCHVPCLVPGGALADHGTRWIPPHPRCLLPVHALRPVFRGKFLAALHSSTTRGTVGFPGETEPLATPEGFRRCLDQLYSKAWIGDAKQAMAGPGHVLADLRRDTHRVASAHHRILEMPDGQGRCP